MKIISSLPELKKLAAGKGIEIRLVLNYGVFSRKFIAYNNGKWSVTNYIDDTEQENLTDKQLGTETNIVRGLKKHAIVMT
jgi:hypothetical protein